MKIYTCVSYIDLTWLPFRSNFDCKKIYIYNPISIITRKCEETTRTTSFLLVQKEWTYSMLSSLLGFRWLVVLNPWQNHWRPALDPLKFSGLWKKETTWDEFGVNQPSNAQMINIFPCIQKELTFLPAVKTSQRVLLTVCWAKVDFENHRLKSGISGRKICFFAGCFFAFPTGLFLRGFGLLYQFLSNT